MRYPKSNARWWELGGIVAAYQSISAPSQLASYQNVGQGRLGTYTAVPGVAPTWSPPTGWGFNGTTQYLAVGIIPTNDQKWSVVVRFDQGDLTSSPRTLLGSITTGDLAFAIRHHQTGLGVVYMNGWYTTALPSMTNGALAVSGRQGYRNGIADAGLISAVAGTMRAIYIGAINNLGSAAQFYKGNIGSIIFASRPFITAEVWLASKQMAYCEQNPDWNAWASRRRYWIVSPAAAIRWPVIGRGIVDGHPSSTVGSH